MIRSASDPNAIEEAAAILARGGLVALPTETVYGLGADATNGEAVARVFAAKGRPSFNPLIAHVPECEAAQRHGVFSDAALRLAEEFWPGPLTLVVPRRPECAVSLLATAGLDTIALRAPAHPAAQTVLRRLGVPLAAPSANRSGRVSPTTAAHVAEELSGSVDLILDGGPCPVGLESTVVAAPLDGACMLLRPGGVPREAIEALVGPLATAGEAIRSPGMLSSHYAPAARLRLNAAAPEPGEAYLGFGGAAPEGALNLSPKGDLAEAAANLFAFLRQLDHDAQAIAVAPIPRTGLGEAINDRLTRAAAPR